MEETAPQSNPAPQAASEAPAEQTGKASNPLMEVYLESLQLIERLHRRFLDVVKVELDRLGTQDINNIQTLILYNIGDGEMTVGELTSRGYYLGSNVSYNVKKLVEHGYLIQQRSTHDRRSFHVRASDKGLEIYQLLDILFEKHSARLPDANLSDQALSETNATLRRVEQFWAMPKAFFNRLSPAA